MLGVSNVTNTTVKNYNNRIVAIVNDFTLGELTCSRPNTDMSTAFSLKPNSGVTSTVIKFTRTLTNNTNKNLTFNEVWLALTVQPKMYPGVTTAACIVKQHLDTPITVNPSKSATVTFTLSDSPQSFALL